MGVRRCVTDGVRHVEDGDGSCVAFPLRCCLGVFLAFPPPLLFKKKAFASCVSCSGSVFFFSSSYHWPVVYCGRENQVRVHARLHVLSTLLSFGFSECEEQTRWSP